MTMKTLLGAMMLAGALLGGATLADAATAMTGVHAQVLQRAPDGRATQVQVGGKDYAVCSAAVQDDCINPRQAGLHYGNAPLGYWPGRPSNNFAN